MGQSKLSGFVEGTGETHFILLHLYAIFFHHGTQGSVQGVPSIQALIRPRPAWLQQGDNVMRSQSMLRDDS